MFARLSFRLPFMAITGGQEAASSSLVTRTIQSVVIVAERLIVTKVESCILQQKGSLSIVGLKS